MKYTSYFFLLLSSVLLLSAGCRNQGSPIPENDEKAFSAYWDQGKAEISSYELNQSLNGVSHIGRAILIFVTEDFSHTRFVKLEEPQKHSAQDVKVLKLNMTREFVTGISNFSMMSSVFTPINFTDYPHSLKLTASSQDWSGQSFMETLWKKNRYEVQQMSYFDSEGDASYTLVNAWLEDEIWTKIRVAPHTLPIGDVKMIPSAFYIRLSHKENKVYEAKTTFKTSPDHYTYSISYPDLKRTLDIDFELAFPHRITGWKEVYGNNEVTTGHLLKSTMSDYWLHDHPADEALRDSLDLN